MHTICNVSQFTHTMSHTHTHTQRIAPTHLLQKPTGQRTNKWNVLLALLLSTYFIFFFRLIFSHTLFPVALFSWYILLSYAKIVQFCFPFLALLSFHIFSSFYFDSLTCWNVTRDREFLCAHKVYWICGKCKNES